MSETNAAMESDAVTPRQSMNVDLVCVGFGPATGGFLTTLTRAMADPGTAGVLESRVMPGMPLQVLCYERADDLGFGVSGVVTRARGIRESFPDLDPAAIPMAHPVTEETVVYLMDTVGASRRSPALRAVDLALRPFRGSDHALELPIVPEFLRKDDGLLLSIGQFNQWVASNLMASGLVQLWPGMPVAAPLIENDAVVGVRLADQGTDRNGRPEAAYMPGMDIRADLTVVGDGPVGPVGRKLDAHFGMPEGHHRRDWAVGMKMVLELPPDSPLAPGTVIHTLGFPEPEIFGFLYVYPGGRASAGIFVPSWLQSPVRTAYRTLQYWMRHPYLWKRLEGATMRSWGAKSLAESGRRGEPHLVGNGYARIGEGSGSTNVLTGSGVDEAWTTGVLLAEGVIQLLAEKKPFTREQLEAAYVRRRRESWLDAEARTAAKARDGFQRGVIPGLLGMGLTGLTGGRVAIAATPKPPHEHVPRLEDYVREWIPPEKLGRIRAESEASGTPLRDVVMAAAGWPEIPLDGKLLVSHQDALLMGGKVQAAPGYADHVTFVDPGLCESCGEKICIEMCSGQALTPGEHGVPRFDREKCVHCGACLWNCSRPRPGDPERGNIEFGAGAGGLHSAEN
jgi:electron-transferring-flavoprotein dehydrogenase